MKVSRILRNIASHPLNRKRKIRSILTFFWWQTRCRLLSAPYKYRFTDRSFLLLKKGSVAATANLYYGLQEFSEMGFLLHFLRSEDLFIDVGANIGGYTVLAAKHVGANTISLEPVPRSFKELKRNIEINHIGENVAAFQVAAGEAKGEVRITDDKNSMNHISVDGSGTLVMMDTLDNIAGKITATTLIKIDVEGYELAVLKGGENTFVNPNVKAVILEVNHLAKRYNTKKEEVYTFLAAKGFSPFQYDPFKRMLIPLQGFAKRNTIFLRDVDLVMERTRSAEPVRLKGNIF